MRNVRAPFLVLALLSLLVGGAGNLAAAEEEAAIPAPEGRSLFSDLSAPVCGGDLSASGQQAPQLGNPLAPVAAATCFCVVDRGYCRRNYGTTYFCNPDPCQCEHI
jgi:hypothetical protein